MCLYPREEIKIAKEPILCVKIIAREIKYFFGLFKFWRSPMYKIHENRRFRKVLIACGKLYKELDFNERVVIRVGFHLYDNIRDAEKSYVFYHGGEHIKPAIIPKGAEYCIGDDGDIVANKIIVFENEDQRKKYLKKCV